MKSDDDWCVDCGEIVPCTLLDRCSECDGTNLVSLDQALDIRRHAAEQIAGLLVDMLVVGKKSVDDVLCLLGTGEWKDHVK